MVAFGVQCMEHDVEGMNNVVFVVTLIVYIDGNCTLPSLIYIEVVMLCN